MPHLIWLIDNNYSTIIYALKRTGETKSIWSHFVYPSHFALKQIGILIPVCIMMLFLIKIRKIKVNFKDEKIHIFIFHNNFSNFTNYFNIICNGSKNKNYVDDPVLFIYWSFANLYFSKKFYKRKLKDFI